MRLLLLFLLLIPLVVSLLFLRDLVTTLWVEGPREDLLVFFGIMGSISGLLIYFVTKSFFTPGWAEYDAPGVKMSAQERRYSTKLYICLTYLVLAILGIVFFNYELMKGVLGIIFLVMGLSLLWSSVKVRRARKRLKDPVDFELQHNNFVAFKRIYAILATILGICLVLSYTFLPSWHFVSSWDIGGVMVFLTSTCIWIAMFDFNELKRPQDSESTKGA